MKLTTLAIALAFGLAAASPAPAPVNKEHAAIAENVISSLFERGILESRGCPKNSVCSNHKCYQVYCTGCLNCCSRFEVGSC